MRKRVYKIFLNALDGQEKWLNEMANQGWELVRTRRYIYMNSRLVHQAHIVIELSLLRKNPIRS